MLESRLVFVVMEEVGKVVAHAGVAAGSGGDSERGGGSGDDSSVISLLRRDVQVQVRVDMAVGDRIEADMSDGCWALFSVGHGIGYGFYPNK